MPQIIPLTGRFAQQTPTVIVSGLPRSGTSMMMQVLAAGGIPVLSDGIREADHDNPRGYYELEAVKRTKEDARWLEQAEGHVVKIIHALLMDLPTDRPYRVVLMRRKTDKVIRSQNAMLERLGTQGADLDPEQLAEIYEHQLEQVKSYMDRHACFAYLEVWYGAMIEYTRTQVERINQFVSGELDIEAMLAAVDPSLRRK